HLVRRQTRRRSVGGARRRRRRPCDERERRNENKGSNVRSKCSSHGVTSDSPLFNRRAKPREGIHRKGGRTEVQMMGSSISSPSALPIFLRVLPPAGRTDVPR